MPINQISTQNTFGEWVAATTNLITISNNLTDNFLVSNALITLSRSGISLNVTNSAIINSLTANTINISSTTGNLIVSGNTTLAYANVTKVLTVKDLVVQGTYSLGTASYINIDASGYINAATYLKSTNYLSVGTFINQSGANNTFAGQTAFTNATTSITTLGNVSFGKNATITENLTVTKDLNVSGNTYILKNLGVGTSNPAYRMVVQDTAPGTSVVQLLYNTSSAAGSQAAFQLGVGTGTVRYVNLTNDYNSQFFQIVGVGITTKYEDFDTQFWRNNAGTQLLKLTAASLNVSSNLNVTKSVTIANTLIIDPTESNGASVRGISVGNTSPLNSLAYYSNPDIGVSSTNHPASIQAFNSSNTSYSLIYLQSGTGSNTIFGGIKTDYQKKEIALGSFDNLSLGGANVSIKVADVERMKFFSAKTGVYIPGNLGIGIEPSSAVSLGISRQLTGGTVAFAAMVNGNAQSDVTQTAAGYLSQIGTDAGATPNVAHFYASQGTLTGTPLIQYGFLAGGTNLIGATTNYQFYGSNQSAVTAGKTGYAYFTSQNEGVGGGQTYAFYAAGTANNYFRGSVGIGGLSTGSEKLYVEGNAYYDGFVSIGRTPSSAYSLYIKGTGNTDANATFRLDNSDSNQLFRVGNDGKISTGSSSRANSPYTNSLTGGTPRTVSVNSSGELGQLPSSLRYKDNIENARYGLNEVMQLRSVTFTYKNSDECKNIGFIAEEVDVIGLKEVVYYNDENQPESLNYQLMAPILTKAIQEQQVMIQELKAEVANLKIQITSS